MTWQHIGDVAVSTPRHFPHESSGNTSTVTALCDLATKELTFSFDISPEPMSRDELTALANTITGLMTLNAPQTLRTQQ